MHTFKLSEPEAPASGTGQNLIVPRRGKGILQQQQPGMRTPMCGACEAQIRCEEGNYSNTLICVFPSVCFL